MPERGDAASRADAGRSAVFRSIADWNAAVNGSAWDVEIASPAEAHFGGHFSIRSAGPIDLNVGWVSRQTICRSRKAIRRDQLEFYGLILLKSGSAQISHCGNHVALSQGDMIAIDSSEPYEAAFVDTDTVCIKLAKGWLERQVRSPQRWRGCVISRDDPVTRSLAPTMLRMEAGCLGPVANSGIASSFAQILQMALAPPGEQQSAYCRSTFLRLRKLLADMAHEHDFEVNRFAKACNMSERNVHALFAKFGTTVWTELQSARIESSRRRILNDCDNNKLSVNELAYQSGFTNASHFARRFRSQFGIAPGRALRSPELLEFQ